MKTMWAPWRIEYIRQSRQPGCFLCAAFRSPPRQDRAHLVLKRGRTCALMINRYPYNGGHLLVAPRRHVAGLADLRPAEQRELLRLTNAALAALRRTMRPDGFNLGINLGAAGGAGLRDHLHLHIVPRWTGDTNFMPVFADVKVIPQALDELWAQLAAALSAADRARRAPRRRPPPARRR